jgi:hypothetical protein
MSVCSLQVRTCLPLRTIPEISINEDTGAILGSAGPAIYPATRKFMFGLNVTF